MICWRSEAIEPPKITARHDEKNIVINIGQHSVTLTLDEADRFDSEFYMAQFRARRYESEPEPEENNDTLNKIGYSYESML